MPADEVQLLSGPFRAPADVLGRWLLLWGIAVSGRGQVPVELLAEPWRALPQVSEKYFAAPPSARSPRSRASASATTRPRGGPGGIGRARAGRTDP